MEKKLDNIKMIFLDIDGTLYNTKKEVTEYTKNILNKVKLKEINIVLCSGRSNQSVCTISKQINASKYIIANNGAFVYNYVDNVEIFESVIEEELLYKMWDICEQENIELILESKEQEYINTLIFRKELDGYIKINNIRDILDKKIFQIVINMEKNRENKKIRDMLSNEEKIWTPNYGIGVRSFFFDINNTNIDKGIGIQHLIEKLGIKKEETIAFGDGINDCAMFKECGIGVAMENAKDELKNIADYITLKNDEDGVARFIEKHILDN